MLREMTSYIEAQETMLHMFSLSGSVEGGDLSDEILHDTIAEAVRRADFGQVDGQTTVSRSADPFQSRNYNDALAAVTVPEGSLPDQLSHTVPDLRSIAHDGLELLQGLDLLHRHLLVHLELPILDQAILKIDQKLSQERYRDAPEDERAFSELKWYARDIEYDRSLPDEIDGLTLESHSITTTEVVQSSAAFRQAASIFEQSVTEWRAGNHEASNTLWSDGMAELFLANNQSPFQQ